ncbi:MAG TPA: hypothetical protein VGE07_14115 [Herpetosiphonaceae bacterium]
MSEWAYFGLAAAVAVSLIVFIFKEDAERGWKRREWQLRWQGLPSERPYDWEEIHHRQKFIRAGQVLLLAGALAFWIYNLYATHP